MNKRACLQVGVLLLSCCGGFAMDTSESRIKNVLFIVSDDLKASVLGCYGDEVCKTPNIDKLASEGMVFNRAYCQGMACGPSRTSFMASRYLDAAGVSLAEHFKNNDFYTARVSKIFHMDIPDDILDGTDGYDVPSSWTERFNSQGTEALTPGHYACLNQNIFTDEGPRVAAKLLVLSSGLCQGRNTGVGAGP